MCFSSLSLPAHEDNRREHAWSVSFASITMIVSRPAAVAVVTLLGKKREKEYTQPELKLGRNLWLFPFLPQSIEIEISK